MKHDAIIIGSGLGGLECAYLLGKAGLSVLLLERHTQPGGCMQSYERLVGHTKDDGPKALSLDTGFHYLGGLADGQPLNRAFSELGLLSLPWQRLDADGFDQVTIDGKTFRFAEGYDAFVEKLAMDFPEEVDALQQYVGMLRSTQASFSLAGTAPVFDAALAETAAYDYLSALFHNPLLVNVIAGTSLKTELRRESLPLFAFAHSQSSYIESSWRLRGDGNMIVQSLVDGISRFGGDIVTHAEATELMMHDGSVTSVLCADGEHHEADLFISDIHPVQTLEMITDKTVLKPLYRNRICRLENTCGVFTVSLALHPGSLQYFNHNKYVYQKANVWESPQYIDRVMISARVPEQGDHLQQIDLLTPMSWTLCQPWKDTRLCRRGLDYAKMKEQWAEECISLAETVIPGLRKMVAAIYTSTPLTWRDYTLTPFGSAFGIRKDYRNILMSMLSPRTPVQNLFLTGQNVCLHGVEGVTMTAFRTVNEVFKYRKMKHPS